LLGGSAPSHAFVYAVAIVAAVAVTTTRPMLGALLPAMVDDPRQLAAGNAVLGWIEGVTTLAGPAIAAICFMLVGAWLAFAVFAVFTGVATLASFGLRVLDGADDVAERGPAISGTWGAVRRDSGLRAVLGATAAASFAMGALDLLYVVIAVDVLGGRDADASWLSAAFGIGALVGGSLALTFVGRRGMWVRVVATGGVFALVLVLLGVGSGAAFFAIGLALCGVSEALLTVSVRTLLQRVTEIHLLTPVCALAEAAHMAMLMLGALAVPPLVDAFGTRWAVSGVGVILVLAIAPGIRAMARADRIADAWLDRIPQLQRTDAFALVSGPALETLARQAEPGAFAPGETIIVEGDRGDRFYAITRGEVAVSQRGERIATRGVGEGFGELALLYDIPRTATVQAIDAVEVLTIDRETFLVAVSGFQPTWRRSLDSMVSRYDDLRASEAVPEG
jgi:Cyclic nucleotide-binding domain